MSARGSRGDPRTACLAVALVTLASCSGSRPAPTPRPSRSVAPIAAPPSLSPARWAFFDRLGTLFDEAGHGSPLPRPEPAVVDGVRVILDAGVVVASARHADHFSGFRSLPARFGGGFVLWSEDRVYRAAEFLGEPSPISDVGATGGVRPWLSSVLLRTPGGLLELDPRTLAVRRASQPGLADALAVDDRRAVRLDAVGRASFTVDGGAAWTDVLATRGVLVRGLSEGPAGEVVLATDGPTRLALGKTGGLAPVVDQGLPPPGDLHPAVPSLAAVRPASSRTLPGEILAQAVADGALLPGGRILVARENGVRVLAAATTLPLADADLPGLDGRFAHCQAAPVGEETGALACVADSGALVIDLDGTFARPAVEATFPEGGGGFIGGPGGRLAYDGRCGPEPPASTDLGPGTPKPPELTDEMAAVPPPGPPPEPVGPPELPPDDDARVCVRASTSRWVERRLRGADARRLYRWIPGEDGAVTALVFSDPDGEEGGDAGPRPAPEPVPDGVQVIRVDPADAALAGAAFPAVPVPQKEVPHRSIDVDFWRDGDAVRGWILLPAEGEATASAPPSAQGPAHRLLPVSARRGGRVAGIRIDASGHVTVHALPPGVAEVVTGGPFALAMAPGEHGHTWFETVDGGATWTPVEGPPVGALESPTDPGATFGCSPIGCAWASGVVRLGWGGPPPGPLPELVLTAAAGPRLHRAEPPALDCRVEPGPAVGAGKPSPAEKRSSRAKPAPPSKPAVPATKAPPTPKGSTRPRRASPTAPARARRPAAEAGVPAAPIALRLPATSLGALREHTWTGEVLLPFQPAAAVRHVSASDAALHGVLGSVVPLLGAGAREPVDLLLLVDKHRLRVGGGAASFLPFDRSGRFTVAADAGGGELAVLDADRGALWLAKGDATAPALHLVRVPDVGRTRLTLARRLAGGGLALAGYSVGTSELFAGELDLGRAMVGPLAPLASLATLGEGPGACAGATVRLLVEIPVRLRLARGGAVLEEEVTVSAVIDAGPERVCLAAVEAVLPKGAEKLGTTSPAVLRATLGPGGSASVWTPDGTARGVCSIAKR